MAFYQKVMAWVEYVFFKERLHSMMSFPWAGVVSQLTERHQMHVHTYVLPLTLMSDAIKSVREVTPVSSTSRSNCLKQPVRSSFTRLQRHQRHLRNISPDLYLGISPLYSSPPSILRFTPFLFHWFLQKKTLQLTHLPPNTTRTLFLSEGDNCWHLEQCRQC